jgi:hypothetical protein
MSSFISVENVEVFASLILLFGSIITIISIALSVYAGVMGNRLAWKAGTWTSVEHFQRTQKKWARWALAVFLISLSVITALVILAIVIATL